MNHALVVIGESSAAKTVHQVVTTEGVTRPIPCAQRDVKLASGDLSATSKVIPGVWEGRVTRLQVSVMVAACLDIGA